MIICILQADTPVRCRHEVRPFD